MTTTPEAARLAEEAKRLTDTRPCRTGAILCMFECEGCSKVRKAHAAIDALAALSQPDEARDAARWRGVKARHGMSMVRLATGSSGYSSHKKDGILDAWADMACAEIAAHDPEAFRAEMELRIAELQVDAAMSKEQP